VHTKMNESQNVLSKKLSQYNEQVVFRKYIYSFFLLTICTFLGFLICFCLLMYNKVGPSHQLYIYQINKLNQYHSEIDTIFIGDSSLGNAINARFFNSLSGMNSVNLALSGLYGYAGSYNMLKKAVKRNHIKNVVLVQTLDMISRPVSYIGYLYSMNTFSDFYELKLDEKIDLLETSINTLFSINNLKRILLYFFFQNVKNYTIDNDYIKQTKMMKINNTTPKKSIRVNEEKKIFLTKIVHFCKQFKINLLYLHGPHLNNIDKRSIKEINQNIQSTGIELIKKINYLAPNQIGDNTDHVHPEYKNLLTESYYTDLKKKLVY